MNKEYVLNENDNNNKIYKCNVDDIQKKCKKMEELYFKEIKDYETINNINNKNSEIKLNILLSKMKKNNNKTNEQIININIDIDNDHNSSSDNEIQNDIHIKEEKLLMLL
jgi:hypothetical protein